MQVPYLVSPTIYICWILQRQIVTPNLDEIMHTFVILHWFICIWPLWNSGTFFIDEPFLHLELFGLSQLLKGCGC